MGQNESPLPCPHKSLPTHTRLLYGKMNQKQLLLLLFEGPSFSLLDQIGAPMMITPDIYLWRNFIIEETKTYCNIYYKKYGLWTAAKVGGLVYSIFHVMHNRKLAWIARASLFPGQLSVKECLCFGTFFRRFQWLDDYQLMPEPCEANQKECF